MQVKDGMFKDTFSAIIKTPDAGGRAWAMTPGSGMNTPGAAKQCERLAAEEIGEFVKIGDIAL